MYRSNLKLNGPLYGNAKFQDHPDIASVNWIRLGDESHETQYNSIKISLTSNSRPTFDKFLHFPLQSISLQNPTYLRTNDKTER